MRQRCRLLPVGCFLAGLLALSVVSATVPAQDRPDTTRLLAAARNGDHSAQYEVARIYLEGRGVKADGAEGAKWLKLAAEGGIPDAQNELGVLYEPSYADAAQWYQRAADQGHPGGQYNLGRLHERGNGFPRDQAVAAQWYRKAAQQGYALAQHNIGAMHLEGRGVRRDDAAGAEWLAKAAEQGIAASQYNLGGLYLMGRGVSRDLVRSYLWLTLAERSKQQGAAAALGSVRARLTPAERARGDSLVAHWVDRHRLPVR